MNFIKLFVLILTIFILNNNAFADAAKGKKIFTKCKACHNAEETKHKVDHI